MIIQVECMIDVWNEIEEFVVVLQVHKKLSVEQI